MGPDPQGFISTARERGITIQAWSPLGHGGHGSDEILHGHLITSIGAAHNKSSVQIALKWLLAHGAGNPNPNPNH
jgi:diketogulonate reductase-like aldo/keto reductase